MTNDAQGYGRTMGNMMEGNRMNVTLLKYTTNADELAAFAASVCTNREPSWAALCSAVDQGHESVLEHVSFTFLVEGVSRVLLAQLTRHRLASFSVQSQRHVSYREGFEYVIPESIEELGEEDVKHFRTQMEQMHRWYCEWCDRLGERKREDARFVLPEATETKILMTVNGRELRHILYLRECEHAQWEIRRMASAMHNAAKTVAPLVLRGAGPDCRNCRETRPCRGKKDGNGSVYSSGT